MSQEEAKGPQVTSSYSVIRPFMYTQQQVEQKR